MKNLPHGKYVTLRHLELLRQHCLFVGWKRQRRIKEKLIQFLSHSVRLVTQSPSSLSSFLLSTVRPNPDSGKLFSPSLLSIIESHM